MVDPKAVESAYRLLKPVVFHTPLAPSPHLGRLVGAEVHLKLENLQRTGSFKIRGAYNRLQALALEKPGSRVVAASAGNHAQGVALAARLLGLEAVIFMPRSAPISKQEATAAYGAQVRLAGDGVAACLAAAEAMAGEATVIHPFDDDRIIAGQGTIGLEILEDLPDVEAVVLPVGGGGLIAGVASAIKARAPRVRVLGVEPAGAASASAALASGRPVEVEIRPSLADGTLVPKLGDRTYPLVRDLVDGLAVVGEAHLAQAMLLLIERRRVVAEGAGALPLAAMLAEAFPDLAGKKVVLVVSGGNIDANLIGRIIDRGLVRSRRIIRFSVILDDHPGALARLLTRLALLRANVLQLFHDRLDQDLPIDQSRVGLVVETRGSDHAGDILRVLAEEGYDVDSGP
ncbi:MAG: threonine ammonia-lyase [Proteobacteria bacterium]|nr:threonine ammonia-lyase [Pseudomonadota bacterium]